MVVISSILFFICPLPLFVPPLSAAPDASCWFVLHERSGLAECSVSVVLDPYHAHGVSGRGVLCGSYFVRLSLAAFPVLVVCSVVHQQRHTDAWIEHLM